MKYAQALYDKGIRLIDFSADFRINDVDTWSRWYGMEHACPHLLAEAVYGLPEFKREAIRNARLVANPGCYPTAVQLGFMPLVRNGLVETDRLIADCKSGVSGAGRNPNFGTMWSLNNNGQSGGTIDADIDGPESWDLTTGSTDVVIAVIDSGAQLDHEDLAQNIWVNPVG